jgi:aminoglycoside/choline kinase family phosphotransferase
VLEVVPGPEEITADWLTYALRRNGRLGSRVEKVTVQPIGAGVGLMAEIARLSIDYAERESLPQTMIAKCAARNENRDVARVLDFYNREVDFYNRIAHECPIRVPQTYYGAVDQESLDFVLLMEDLGDVAPNDQITGSSADEAMEKVSKVARLHARYWGRVREPQYSWMYDMEAQTACERLRDLVYRPALAPALDKFSGHFSADARQMCGRVGEQFVEIMQAISPARTFVHGDYRQDNFIYRAGDGESVVMDWQISGAWLGTFDVTYLLCQSLRTDLRRELERPLLQAYVNELRNAGVADYDFESAWQDYRLLCLYCLIYPITVCGSLDLANPRGRALAECMLDRNLQVIEDLDCAALLA